MNAASVQLFGAGLAASDFARVTDKPEVVPGQESCSRRSLRSPFLARENEGPKISRIASGLPTLRELRYRRSPTR
jgi:hypothetical protein